MIITGPVSVYEYFKEMIRHDILLILINDLKRESGEGYYCFSEFSNKCMKYTHSILNND